MLGVWKNANIFGVVRFFSYLRSMKQVRPKKNLGQHFLTDLTIAKRIADTVDEPYGDLPVLEVGPGMGVMTQYLVRKPRQLKVVEIDFESVASLRRTFPELEDSIIEEQLAELSGGRLKLPIGFRLKGSQELLESIAASQPKVNEIKRKKKKKKK